MPFSLRGGACLLTGVGEVIAPLPPLRSGAFLIVVLGSVATASAYAATQSGDFSSGARVAQLAQALRDGLAPDPDLFGSQLQAAAMRAVPDLAPRLQSLLDASPGVAWAMTGSGGAFFSFQADGPSAAALARKVAPACPGAGIRLAVPLAQEVS